MKGIPASPALPPACCRLPPPCATQPSHDATSACPRCQPALVAVSRQRKQFFLLFFYYPSRCWSYIAWRNTK